MSALPNVSDLFDPSRWREIDGFDFTDITYHRAVDQGTVRIAFDRPEIRNAFRKAASAFHPDRFADRDETVQRIANQHMQELVSARDECLRQTNNE